MKIRFTQNFRPKGDSPDIPSYKKGEEHTFAGVTEEGYARKYVARGLAVEVTEAPPRAAQPRPALSIKGDAPSGAKHGGSA